MMRLLLKELIPPVIFKIPRLFINTKKKRLSVIEEDITALKHTLQLILPKESVIIGNGPSFQQFMDKHSSFLIGKSIFCVNAFATSDYFCELKPQFCVFADCFYWSKEGTQATESIQNTYKCLKETVTWKLYLLFPVGAREWNFAIDLPNHNPNIKIGYFNNSLDDSSFKFDKYKSNLAMPLSQTVTVAALFLSLNLGFKRNYLVGVDMSLHVNVFVNEENVVCNREQHFYDKGEAKVKPFINTLQETIKMDLLFYRLSLMFKGFLEMEEYSKFLGAKVYNLSKDSFIDAFERVNLDDVST
jgi:hypothetical protein